MATGTKNITVYSFRRCPFAMRVRMVLHEKGIPFEVVEEDLSNFSEKLRSLHPEAKVPVLVHGERVIYESAIITEYIEDAFPATNRLMPIDPGDRAEVRLWTYWCNHVFKPDLDRFKYGPSRFPVLECEGSEAKVIVHLEKISAALKKNEWLVTGNFTLADIHVFPFCRQLLRMSPQPSFLDHYPTVNNWVERIVARPSFLSTMKNI